MEKGNLRSVPTYYFHSVDSTNRVAMDMADDVGGRYAVISAEEQTAGRGRLGRSFFSPSGGIYMSLVVSLKGIGFQSSDIGFVTTAAAVSVSKAIESVTGLGTGIKWINDVLVNEKKVCGILCEGKTCDGRLSHIVIGIGVNAGSAVFPPELDDIAGSLSNECGYEVDKDLLLGEIVYGLTCFTDRLFSREKENCETVKREIVSYAENYSTLIGKKIKVFNSHRMDEYLPAVALGIDERTAGLVVRYEDGREEVITSGEVSVRSMQDRY